MVLIYTKSNNNLCMYRNVHLMMTTKKTQVISIIIFSPRVKDIIRRGIIKVGGGPGPDH